MELLIAIGMPFALALVAMLPLHFLGARWILRICNAAIAIQVALAAAAWFLLETLPEKDPVPGEQPCPDFSTARADVLDVVAFSSIAVGAVALGSAVLGKWRGAAGWPRVLAGLGAVGLTFAIFIGYLALALCGLN